MSLVDPRTAAYWPFDEQHDSVLPADAAGRVPDLQVPTARGRPAVADQTITGFGRMFVRAENDTLFAPDTGALRLTRNLTISAIAQLDVGARTVGDLCTLIQRGRGGASDPVSFGLRVEVVDRAARVCRMLAFWQTEAGADVADAGVTFTWPQAGQPEDDFLLLSATREVIAGRLAVRYQVNGEVADGERDHALDCGGATAADVALGAGMSGPDSYHHRWDGIIDAVHVLNQAVLPEEFLWTWERIAIDAPAGIETMRKSVPPGVYSTDSDSRIQRELAVEGAGFGHSKSIARRLRFYFLPEVCFGEVLERWEEITGHSPKPGDHLALRRDRVAAFVRTKRGFRMDDVKAQLAELFDLEADEVEILEFDNDYRQDFAAGDPGNSIAIAGNGVISYTGGELVLSSPGGGATNADMRYGGAANPRSTMVLWSLASEEDAWVAGKIRSVDPNTGEAAGGLVLGSRSRDEWVFIGLRQAGILSNSLVAWTYRSGALSSSATVLVPALNVPEAFLRVCHTVGGFLELRVGGTAHGGDAGVPIPLDSGIATPEWAGFFVGAPGNFPVENAEVAFNDFFTHTPTGDQRFNWFVYRNPALPGNPDIIGAREVVRRIKPAHTQASACTVRRLVCGDPRNGCGNAPLGR